MKRRSVAMMIGLLAAVLISLTVANLDAVVRGVERTAHLTTDALEAAALGVFLLAVVFAFLLGAQARNRRRELAHVEQLSNLYAVGMRIDETSDLDEMLDVVSAEARRELAAETCAVVLLGLAEGEARYSVSSDHVAGRHVWDIDALIAEAGGMKPGSQPHRDGASRLVAPLVSKNDVIGVIGLHRDLGFSLNELTVFDIVASQAGLALRNAGLHADVEQLRAELEASHEELQEAQTQLLQAQRQQSIGELAAGIAHEINAPIQLIGDSAHLLGDHLVDVLALQAAAAELSAAVRQGQPVEDVLTKYDEASRETDLEVLSEEIPRALTRVGDGVDSITEIVSALETFSTPAMDVFSDTDINRSLENALIVSRNEWSDVAELVTEYDPDLPLVPALSGPLNQAVLNIIVNAAKAIQDVGDPEPGTITVSTAVDGDHVEIGIADTGAGIPSEIRDRVFDPYFTTREVGDGMGQGLSIARNVVVDQHGGELSFTSEVGVGTRFTIRLPLGHAPILSA